ncbi:hypothetical protein MOO45_02295 [Bombilactobacillus folatiphilus]|uniref:Uncharacterized protein n=1 Tax=Bombilactobacillus folatiphilus TaxID=2923362 RepID=A0ABY4PA10_9LACO|nr:hypothetical protein [Bombilactobacillus folatiphilus]UQS82502.1 hypothetical protein MOO45_02295 [Bombilactobacillus folatiphilus]
MTKKTYFQIIISSLILGLSFFLSSTNTPVKADSTLNQTILSRTNPNADIDDGVKNWAQLMYITPSYINLGGNTQLGYTFGSWEPHGVVPDNTSSTIKSNFFIKHSEQYIQALFTTVYNTSYDPATSMDFALVSPLPWQVY